MNRAGTAHRTRRFVLVGMAWAWHASGVFAAEAPSWTSKKSVTELTDADIEQLSAVPGPVWSRGETARVKWGRWLCAVHVRTGRRRAAGVSPPLTHVNRGLTPPARLPALIRKLQQLGVDLVAGPVDGETLAGTDAPAWKHYGPDHRRVPEFLSRWLATGRGLTASQVATPLMSGLDRARPQSVEYVVRKLKGYRQQFGTTARDDGGRQFIAWLGPAGAMRQPHWDEKGEWIDVGTVTPAAQRLFQQYLARVYDEDITRFCVATGLEGITDWKYVEAPRFEDRLTRPVLWYHWCRFRQWLRHQVVTALPVRLGLVNLADEATRATALRPEGAWAGYDPYQATLASAVVTVDIGGAPGPFAAGLAMVDSVLRTDPKKQALAVLDCNASRVAKDAALLNRRMAQALGRVSQLRGLVLAVDSADDLAAMDENVLQAVAWWNRFGETQAPLLDGLVTLRPRAATYFPQHNVFFDDMCKPDVRRKDLTDCRSRLWANHVLALQRMGYPIHVLLPEQIENGQLHQYELLFCLYGPRHSEEAIRQINLFWHDPDEIEKWRAAMRKKHGPTWQPTHKDWTNKWVLSTYDNLGLGLDGEDNGALKRIQRTEIWERHDRKPLWDRKGEITGPNRSYTITLASPALPRVGTTLPSYNGLLVAQPFHGAYPYASHKGKPVIIGTRKGMWIGTDLATDIALACPAFDKDPASPLQMGCPSAEPDTYRAMVGILSGYMYLAQIYSPLKIRRNGKMALAAHASLLTKEPAGWRLAIITNDAAEDQTYDVAMLVRGEEVVWDLRTGKPLPRGKRTPFRVQATDGTRTTYIRLEQKVTVPAGGFVLLLAGPGPEVKAACDRQGHIERR